MGQSRPCRAEPVRECDLQIAPKQEKTWERCQREAVREHGHRPVRTHASRLLMHHLNCRFNKFSYSPC